MGLLYLLPAGRLPWNQSSVPAGSRLHRPSGPPGAHCPAKDLQAQGWYGLLPRPRRPPLTGRERLTLFGIEGCPASPEWARGAGSLV